MAGKKPALCHPDRARHTKDGLCSSCKARRRRYGVSPAWVRAMLDLQEDKCAVCGEGLVESSTHVDHNSKTGEARGLLCATCNCKVVTAVEHFGHLLENGRRYLKEHT